MPSIAILQSKTSYDVHTVRQWSGSVPVYCMQGKLPTCLVTCDLQQQLDFSTALLPLNKMYR